MDGVGVLPTVLSPAALVTAGRLSQSVYWVTDLTAATALSAAWGRDVVTAHLSLCQCGRTRGRATTNR